MGVVPFSPPADVDSDAVSEPYWASLREGVLSLQRCSHGHDFRMPPTLYCPVCLSTNPQWVKLSGRGTLYSYTATPLRPRESDSPYYVAALVCPDEAPDTKIFANLVECEIEELHIDMALELVRAEAGVDVTWFRPVSAGDRGDA